MMRRPARAMACSSPSYSPDGSRIAYLTEGGGARRLAVRALLAAEPVVVSPSRLLVESVAWSPTRELIALVARRAGEVAGQLLVMEPDGSVVAAPTAPGGAASGLTVSGWSRAGAEVWCSATTSIGGTRNCCAFDVDRREWSVVYVADTHGTVADDRRGGAEVLVTVGAERRLCQQVLLVNRSSASARVVLRTGDRDESVAAAGFGPDGSVLVLSNVGAEFTGLVQVTGTGADAVVRRLRTRDDADLESVLVSRDRSRALLVWNVAGRSSCELYDVRSGQTVWQADPPGDVVWGVDLTADGARAAMAVSGSDTYPSVVELAIAGTGAPAPPQCRWVAPSAPLRPPPGAVRPSLVEFSARDGLPLSGWWYEPPRTAADRTACVVSLHGGPQAQERPGFNPLYQALLATGTAVFAPNVRGSRGFGRTFMRLDDREGRWQARQDVVDVARHLVEEGLADHSSLGVIGSSYGGYLALCAVQDAPELFAACVAVAAVVDLAGYVSGTEPWRRPMAAAEFGDPTVDAELLAALSPSAHLERCGAPVLFLHGSLDPVAPVADVMAVVDGLRRLGKPTSLRLLPGAGHGFEDGASAGLVTRKAVSWFSRHLTARTGRRPVRVRTGR